MLVQPLIRASAALFSLAFLGSAAAGCTSGTDGTAGADPAAERQRVVARYAVVAKASYDLALAKARVMKTTIDAFVDAPSEASLEAARNAWLAARTPYGETESFRYFDGPIDDEKGPEGRVNGWPLDEAFIDYVVGDDTAGLINRASELPIITKQLLGEQNEKGGEANVATGWHAIEFLLWGQDLSETGPGARPFSDYVTGTTMHQKGAERRRTYLKVVTELLVDDLEGVARAWDSSQAGTYGAAFVAAPEEGLAKAFRGMVMLSGLELARERMNNAYTKGEQEEEHSCFSDNTLADLLANARAIENVYLGRAGADDGPGIDELVRAKDAAVDARIKEQFAALLAAIQSIPAPFDQAFLREPGRSKLKSAIDACKALNESLVEAGAALGVTVAVEE